MMRVSGVIVVLAFTHSMSAASAALACSSDSHWLIDTTLSSSIMTPYEMYPGVLVTMGWIPGIAPGHRRRQVRSFGDNPPQIDTQPSRYLPYWSKAHVIDIQVDQQQRIDGFGAKIMPRFVVRRRTLAVNAKTGQRFRHGNKTRVTGDARPVLEVAELDEIRVEPAEAPRHVAVKHDCRRLTYKVYRQVFDARRTKKLRRDMRAAGKSSAKW